MHTLPLLVATLLSVGAPGTAPSTLNVAAVQYPIETGLSASEIVGKVRGYVEEAKKGGADVVVFPELITFDAWPKGDKRSDTEVTRWIARKVTPRFFDAITALAKEHAVMIVGGSSPRLEAGRVYNTAIVAFPDGRVVHQDKLHLTYWEAESGFTGGDEVRPFDAPFGRAVVLICYDSEFPTVSSSLMQAEPLVWFVPSMTDTSWGLQRVRWSSQARAVEHHAFVVVTGTVGEPSKSFPNVGQAAFLTPRREGFRTDVDQGRLNRPGVVHAVLDLDRLRASRAKAKLYPAKDATARERPLRVKVVSPR